MTPNYWSDLWWLCQADNHPVWSSECLIMNEWGREVVAPSLWGLRTKSVFSQCLLSSCKCCSAGCECQCRTMRRRTGGSPVSPVSPGGSYYLNYWEQSAETHLTTDLSISTRSAFLSLFKTRKYWLVLWVSRQFSNNQEYWIFIQDPQLLIRDRKIKFNLQETCGTWESHVKEKRKWNMISMSFVIFPIVCTILF